MKGTAIGIFIAVLLLTFLQPLIEMANVMKEKVTLGAAILNSCRAARNNALESYDGYFDDYAGDHKMGDLDAFIEEDMFREFFAEAFGQTLNLGVTYSSGGKISFESIDGRWGEMTVEVDLEYDDADVFDFDFSGRRMSSATVRVETPYVFRTVPLKTMASITGGVYRITETRKFIVQMIN